MFIVRIFVTYGNFFFFCNMFALIDEILWRMNQEPWPLAWLSGGKLDYVTWIEKFFFSTQGEKEGESEAQMMQNYNMKNKR